VPKYILDANIFITSHHCHYGMDFCPAFWHWLTRKNQTGSVFSIDRIRSELEKRDDEIHAWAKDRGDDFFLSFDQPAIDRLAELAEWSQKETRFKDSARTEFLASADMYLISYALAHGCIVVTHEVLAPDSKKKIHIPDACAAVGVECMNLWRFLRVERARFVISDDP
jgi:hypothetical protein